MSYNFDIIISILRASPAISFVTVLTLFILTQSDMYLFLVVLIFLGELLNNILKHAEARTVELSLEFKQTAFIIELTDDGKGFDVTQEKVGNGMHSMARRAASCGGTLLVDSKIGGPTSVKLMLKIK